MLVSPGRIGAIGLTSNKGGGARVLIDNLNDNAIFTDDLGDGAILFDDLAA